MKDTMLKALLTPTNMLFSVARWPGNGWQIRNASGGHSDVYKLLVEAENHRPRMARYQAEVFASGALAHEYVILRPTWNEIEEFVVTREDLE